MRARTRTPRYPRQALPLATSLLLLAGCGDDAPSPAPPGGDAVPTSGGTAVVAEANDMGTAMPLLAGTVLDGDLLDMTSMTLLRMSWVDGSPHLSTAEESPMALARRVEYLDADSATLRFHLRSDALWSDGVPVTAGDVVWTYRALGDAALASPRTEFVAQLDTVFAENDSTVVFGFRRAYPELLFHAGHSIAPAHVYEGVAMGEVAHHPSTTDPALLPASGPFRVARRQVGQRIVLVRNPHFQPRPHLDSLVIRIIPDETTRLVELRNGGVDAMRVSSPMNLPALEAEAPAIRLERIERRFGEFVVYNELVEPFRDPEVRRALGLAVNVPELIEALQMTGYADPAASVYSPIFAELRDPGLTPLGHDPERAARILEERGWVDGDGDGVREKGGERLGFTLLSNTGNQRRSDTATMLQQYWARIGAEVRLQQLEFQTLNARLGGKEFEASLYGWQVPLSPDLSGQWAPEAQMNFGSYRNPRMQVLMRQAQEQETEAAARPYWLEAARLVAADQPYTWLFYMDQVVAVRDRLRGTRIDSFGMYQNAWEWWVVEGR